MIHSSDMSVSWSATIEIMSDLVRGIQVRLLATGSNPQFLQSKCDHEFGHATRSSAFNQLRKQLLSTVDLQPIVKKLKTSFEDIRKQVHMGSTNLVVCNPIFNYNGDLLLELKERQQEQAHATETKKFWFLTGLFSFNSMLVLRIDNNKTDRNNLGKVNSIPPPIYSPDPQVICALPKQQEITLLPSTIIVKKIDS